MTPKQDDREASQDRRKRLLASQLQASSDPRALLKLQTIIALTGLCRATIYNRINDGSFPAPIKIGSSSRWRSADIHHWLTGHQGEEVAPFSAPCVPPDERGLSAAVQTELRVMALHIERLTERVELVRGELRGLAESLDGKLTRVGHALSSRR